MELWPDSVILNDQEKRMPSIKYEISLLSFPLFGQVLNPIWCVASFDIVVKL